MRRHYSQIYSKYIRLKLIMTVLHPNQTEIPEELWNHLTRIEEYECNFQDKFERFSYYQSEYRNILDPIVSSSLIKNESSPIYPHNKPFAVCLTHDIDTLYRSFLMRLFYCINALRHKDKMMLKQNILAIFNKKKPFFNIREIMDLEEKYGAKSSFYFLALKPGEQDFNYNVGNLKDELKEIDTRGWEVGLHGGHQAWNSFDKLIEEKERLEAEFGKPVIGYRNHYLHFKVPDTWEYLAKAGIKYDTTFGYADCVGFRNGMCHPYCPYNMNTKKYIDIMEIPLVVMDVTLFGYMHLTKEDAFNLVKKLIDIVSELNGVFTLLWHNSYLIEGTWQHEMYENILSYCQEKNAWMTSGKEIYEWVMRDEKGL